MEWLIIYYILYIIYNNTWYIKYNVQYTIYLWCNFTAVLRYLVPPEKIRLVLENRLVLGYCCIGILMLKTCMTAVLHFLPLFFLPLPWKLPLQQLFKGFSFNKKSRFFSHFIETIFPILFLAKPLFFKKKFIIYDIPRLQQQTNKKFLWIQTKSQQLISYKVTLENKSPPTYPPISWQKVDQTTRNLEYWEILKDRTSVNDINNASCSQLKEDSMTLLRKSDTTPAAFLIHSGIEPKPLEFLQKWAFLLAKVFTPNWKWMRLNIYIYSCLQLLFDVKFYLSEISKLWLNSSGFGAMPLCNTEASGNDRDELRKSRLKFWVIFVNDVAAFVYRSLRCYLFVFTIS